MSGVYTGRHKQKAERLKRTSQRPKLCQTLPIKAEPGQSGSSITTSVSQEIKGTRTRECSRRAERASGDRVKGCGWEKGRMPGVVMGSQVG